MIKNGAENAALVWIQQFDGFILRFTDLLKLIYYQACVGIPKTNACQKISFHSAVIRIFLGIFLKSNSM